MLQAIWTYLGSDTGDVSIEEELNSRTPSMYVVLIDVGLVIYFLLRQYPQYRAQRDICTSSIISYVSSILTT